jgi:hypothetical protein
MVRSERIETLILVGLTSVFILLTICLGINWLTGHEAHGFLILMILVGFSSAPPFYGFSTTKDAGENGLYPYSDDGTYASKSSSAISEKVML